jgi:carboxyl-terminal processing protease
MIGRFLAVAVGLCLLAASFTTAQAEPRIALVIGNSNYGSEIGKLPNPANDAGLIAQSLQSTGFKVIKVIDADQKAMKRKIAEFGDALAQAGPQATGLFYYAGHGVQVQGQNYLIPVGADISKESDVDIESVSADKVIDQMNFAANAVNIIILDACRNNPLQRSFRSATRGLAPMRSDSVRGTFIAYSTSPGQTAADGSGKNSPYSAALASALVQPGVGIEEIFRDVRGKVMKATGDKQIPWDSSSLTAPFFFKPASAQFTTATQPAPAPQPVAKPAATTGAASGNTEMELTYWRSIENSKQASDYQAYLEQFPNGTFAGLARSRMASLGQGVPRAEPATPTVQEPAAAPVVTKTEPVSEPVAEPASTTTDEEAAGGIELDSHGVDCRIMDATRSESDCRNTKRFGPANKAGGYGGGKTSGSHGWN